MTNHNQIPASGDNRSLTESQRENTNYNRGAQNILSASVLIPLLCIVFYFAEYRVKSRDSNVQFISSCMRPSCGINYNSSVVAKGHRLTLNEFRECCDGKWPVLITDVVPRWPAINWTTSFLLGKYGNEAVMVKSVVDKHHDSEGLHMPLEQFHLRSKRSSKYRWIYVMDEVFLSQHPALQQDILPLIYADGDLFQLFPAEIRPWDSMLLWGSAHSRSALHIDPYNWTGTNAVLKGRKRWKLYPPGQDADLQMQRRRCGFPLECFHYNSEVDAFKRDNNGFTNIRKASVLEFEQEAGELLIIPPGWPHQAYNLEETIAVSSQFMNYANHNIIIEEILKTGVIDYSMLSDDFAKMTPEDKVRALVKLLPQSVLDEGKRINEQIRRPPEPHEMQEHE